jgi:hypothetical protein
MLGQPYFWNLVTVLAADGANAATTIAAMSISL